MEKNFMTGCSPSNPQVPVVVVVYAPGAVVLPWSHLLSFQPVHVKGF